KHRLETLQELDEQRAGYAPEVQKLFAEQSSIGVEPRGVLAASLKVDPAAETAIESLFGPALQAVLVPSIEAAHRLSEWLAKEGSGRISALIVGEAELTNAVPVDGSTSVADALGVSQELRSILREVFPREMSARIVESFDTANGSGETLVDRNGDILI